MRRAFLAAFLLIASFGSVGDYGRIYVDEVVRVYDGDTITVNIEQWPPIAGQEVGIRVRGIDAPEIRGECPEEKVRARAARDFALLELRAAETVELRAIDRGKYFRVVADVYVDGDLLADRLVKEGLARKYDGGPRSGWCG